MSLSFFASRNLAEAFHAESGSLGGPLEAFAESLLRVYPAALAEYAYLGRSVIGGLAETVREAPSRVAKVGRNDPCPCGSGTKFKKCCGGTSH